MRFTTLPCLLAAGLLASPAGAYQLRTTAGGAPVHWDAGNVDVVVDPSFSALAPDAIALAARCFAAWQAVKSASPPGVSLHAGQADAIGYRSGEANLNTLRYAPEGSALAGAALMITFSSFDQSGVLLDADILVNGGASRPFAELAPLALPPVAFGIAAYDLADVLTHEAGHFFGLAHEPSDPTVTMFPTSARGETRKRALTADDTDGLAALYPVGAVITSCAVAPSGMPSPATGALGLVALGLLAAGWRRARGARGKASAAGAALAMAALLTPGAAARPGKAIGPGPDPQATATVTGVETRWEDGVAVTRIELSLCDGGLASCAERASVEVLGGTRDGITQVVDDAPVPAVGARVALQRTGARLALPEGFPLRLPAGWSPAR